MAQRFTVHTRPGHEMMILSYVPRRRTTCILIQHQNPWESINSKVACAMHKQSSWHRIAPCPSIHTVLSNDSGTRLASMFAAPARCARLLRFGARNGNVSFNHSPIRHHKQKTPPVQRLPSVSCCQTSAERIQCCSIELARRLPRIFMFEGSGILHAECDERAL